MSEILLRWLNDEVHLRHPVTDFEVDFSNGYAFGELLDKHEMQPDFHLFIDGDHPDAKTNNFVLLEPTLRTLGVKFDSRSASQVLPLPPARFSRCVCLCLPFSRCVSVLTTFHLCCRSWWAQRGPRRSCSTR